jgi:beta-galactosidase/beta-glucuronidase
MTKNFWSEFIQQIFLLISNKSQFPSSSVRLETNQNVRRLQHHPSIALWATNNENEVALRQNWYNTKMNFSGFAESYRRLYVVS